MKEKDREYNVFDYIEDQTISVFDGVLQNNPEAIDVLQNSLRGHDFFGMNDDDYESIKNEAVRQQVEENRYANVIAEIKGRTGRVPEQPEDPEKFKLQDWTAVHFKMLAIREQRNDADEREPASPEEWDYYEQGEHSNPPEESLQTPDTDINSAFPPNGRAPDFTPNYDAPFGPWSHNFHGTNPPSDTNNDDSDGGNDFNNGGDRSENFGSNSPDPDGPNPSRGFGRYGGGNSDPPDGGDNDAQYGGGGDSSADAEENNPGNGGGSSGGNGGVPGRDLDNDYGGGGRQVKEKVAGRGELPPWRGHRGMGDVFCLPALGIPLHR